MASSNGKVGTMAVESRFDLPLPVRRYLRRVLPNAIRSITSVHLTQRGELRTSTTQRRWLTFSAVEHVSLSDPAFSWDAHIALPLGFQLRVQDCYAEGIGEGRVSVFGFPLARERNRSELNEGELHRFLAESPWYPTVLVSRGAVTWTPIDDRSALATLSDHGITVALEFRFDAEGDVCAVFTTGRWSRVDGTYRRVAWEGRFSKYIVTGGLRVPELGEVGWYDADIWQSVWRGRVTAASYRFES